MSCFACDLAHEEEDRISQTRREHIQWYKAFCSKVTDGWLEILAFAPKLAPFQPHPRDKGALVSEFFPKRKPGTNIFDVQVTYSTEVDFTANPLGQAAVITIDSNLRSVPRLQDIDGNPIVNLAGDMIEGVEGDLTDQIIKVEKNIPIKLESWVDDYGDGVVNSDAVTIRQMTKQPGTLKLAAMSIGAEQNTEPQTNSAIKKVPFCVATFELHWRRDGWTLITPNVGFFELVPKAGGKFKNQKAKDNSTITAQTLRARFKNLPAYTRRRITVGDPPDYPPEAVPLDLNGSAIINPTPADVLFLEYVLNEQRPFKVLPLK